MVQGSSSGEGWVQLAPSTIIAWASERMEKRVNMKVKIVWQPVGGYKHWG